MSLEAAAAEFARENPDEVPQPPPPAPNANAPGSRAEPTPTAAPSSSSQASASSTSQPEGEDDDEDEVVTPEDTAKFAIGLLDVAMTNFIGARMELTPKQERKLVKLAVPLVKKYMPDDLAEVVSPEVAFIGGALMIYAPKYLSPEPGADGASPPGGNADGDGSSGGPSSTTEATIDGKAVKAEVS